MQKAKTPAKEKPGKVASNTAPVPGWSARLPVLLGLALVFVTAAVYLPVAKNEFVNYDDSDYVTANAHVQSGLKRENLVWAFQTGHASNWHPVTWVSHMLDCQLFGAKPLGPHVVNAALHVINTLLLFIVLQRMTAATWRSAIVAALFALHPLHVESVAWISERKDVLSTLFFLLTLWSYAERSRLLNLGASTAAGQPSAATSTGMPAPRFAFNAWFFYGLSLAFFALGLMSKPMLVTVPFVLLLLDYWPLNRAGNSTLGAAGSARLRGDSKEPDGAAAAARVSIFRLLLEKLPFFILVIASSVVTFLVQRKGGAVSTSITLGARIANALVSYGRYLRKTFWPDDLSVLYPHPGHWPGWQVGMCAALLVVISVLVFLPGRDRRYLVVGWLWFLGTMVPVIGLVQVGIQSMADRYTYIPLIGVFLMLVWGVADLIPPRPWRAPAFALGGLLILGSLAWVTVRQIHFWRNSETLFQRAVAVTRNNYLAYNNLGYYLAGIGKSAEAMTNYEMSLRINPAYEDALNNLGYAYAGRKNYPKAIELYEAALRIRPKHPEVHNNLGNALAEVGKVDEAIVHYEVTLAQNPDHADAHNNLGIALAMKGKVDEAIPHFYKAIRIKPTDAGAHSNLGNALAAQHKLPEAIKEYEEALRLKPDDARSQNNLGNVLAEQGRVEEAVAHYQEALRLNADNPEAEYNLGLALVRLGKREDAAVHLREALRLRPDYPEARQQLTALTAAPPK